MTIAIVPSAGAGQSVEQVQVMQGVYEERSPFPGTRAFVVYDAAERRIVNVVAASHVIDADFLAQMRAFGERVARGPLRLVD
jgi:hypothetical protein